MAKKIRLGIFGLGVVGSGLVNIVRKRKKELLECGGVELEIVKAVVRDPAKKRPCDLSGIQVSANLEDILKDDSLDIVVELIGGIEPAASIVKSSLERRKAVVSANKALIAAQGEEIMAIAKKAKRPFYAEASVGGGIPILKSLRESLVANDISSLTAIINGTTNFILTKMEEEGLSYFEALKLAGDLGFAEADPTMDVEGFDAQQKLRILAAHISGGAFPEGDIPTEGISKLTARDFAFAAKNQMSIKLLAIARRKNGRIELRVHPTLIPKVHPLASVRNEFNAIYLNGDAVGEIMLSGRGAGSLPTASAVYADIIDISTRSANPQENETREPPKKPTIIPAGEIESEYYLRFTVYDKPGVIGSIATTLGKHNISVSSAGAELIPNVQGIGEVDIVVHKAKEENILAALKELSANDRIKGPGKFIRIERGL